MLRNISFGQYIPRESLIHNLDPRIKILSCLAIIISLFLLTEFWGYLILGTFVMIGIIISQIHPKFVFKGLRSILFIIMFTLIIHLFMTEGEVLYQLSFLKITKEGLIKGLFISCRLFILILATSLLTLTTSPISLTDGIEKLLSFFKFIGMPAHEIAMMMTIALRFIPTLLEETEKIMKAQISRGADFDTGNIFNRTKNLIPILIPLFVNAFRRADELAIAMEAKCYRGGEGRTHFRQLKIRVIDILTLILTSIITIIASVLF
ncbi:MAG TPA: transporter [Candidatus Atribacteria bacterium]|nr:transporter [Candidatus Atribacteria bacterium]